MTKKKSKRRKNHSKTFKDYLEFRVLLLNNGIKNQTEFAKFIGLGGAAVSERFSRKQDWKLKELVFMSQRFKRTIDELCAMLDIKI